jgi:GTP cyclohydrolase IB
MNAPDHFLLPDIQARRDMRNIAIDRVGVRAILHPIQIESASLGVQHTVASIDMYVGLAGEEKGTHMSRFLELLGEHRGSFDAGALQSLMAKMLERLGAGSGYIEMRFPYFVSKRAPVSGVQSLLDYKVVLRAEASAAFGSTSSVEICAPVTSLCPCSKEISDYGAHNQRSELTIRVELDGGMQIEELIRVAEQEASCEVFGLLKRPDEKWVTERAYDNPKFVEDLVRDIALRLDGDDRITRYTVESENFESIHNHSAYARIERNKFAA